MSGQCSDDIERIANLPAYLKASHGLTRDGTPTGNLVYAGACYLLAVALTLSVTVRAGRPSALIRREQLTGTR